MSMPWKSSGRDELTKPSTAEEILSSLEETFPQLSKTVEYAANTYIFNKYFRDYPDGL